MKLFTRLLGGILTASLLAVAIMGLLPVSTVQAVSETYTVNNLSDSTNDGTCDAVNCTLREAITDANANADADTIVFSVSGTITLTSTLPSISGELKVDGTGQKVTISGGDAVQILIVNNDSALTINALTLQNGKDGVGGGAIYNKGLLTVTNSTYQNNRAPAGGAIYNDGALEVVNSTFAENGDGSTNYGGAIYSKIGSVSLFNSTLSANRAINGGGIYIASSSTMDYANTIIANSVTGGDCVNIGTISTNTNNFVEDHSCAATYYGDPKLDALDDNGGSTKTFGLLPDSPARDAGDDTVCAAAPVSGKDQRGETRPDGPHCDIGAFEAEFIPLVMVSPSALHFGEQAVGTVSVPKGVTVTNTGSGSQMIGTLSISGEFALASNTCDDATLDPSEYCSFSVAFSPVTIGAKTGMVTIADIGTSTLATLPLTGEGIFPVVGLSATSLIFAPQFIGTTSAAQTVTLTNTGTGTLEIGTLSITGDFSFRTNTCNAASLPAAGTCAFSVAFSPRDIGIRSGAVSIPSNASTSPNRVTLRGTIKAGTQLLKMGNFDTVVTPIPWLINSPYVSLVNLRDRYVFLSPFYSAKFIGYKTNPALSASQIITRTGRAGDKFYISLSSRASKVPVNGLYRLTVTFHNGLQLVSTKTLNFTNGTHYFQTLSYYYTAPAAYTRIMFNFTYQKTGGIAWFDNAAVILLP